MSIVGILIVIILILWLLGAFVIPVGTGLITCCW